MTSLNFSKFMPFVSCADFGVVALLLLTSFLKKRREVGELDFFLPRT